MKKELNRYRHILDFALSSLIRRRARVFSLMAVYTLIVFFVASLIFFVQAIKREVALTLSNAPDLIIQRMIAGRHDLIPTNYTNKIREIRGVTNVCSRLWGYYYDPVFGANYTLLVPDTNPPAVGSIKIGAGVARNQRIKSGDMLTLQTASKTPLLLTVQDIYPTSSEIVSSDLMIMSAEDFTTMFNFPADKATDLAVTVVNTNEQITVASKIAEMFPDVRPILKSEILRTYNAIFDWRGGMMLVVVAMSLLSFIIFVWDKASGLSAEERKEIGILKSIGWETSDVLLLKFWEGVVVSLTAFLCGILFAYCHIFLFSAALFGQVLKGWSVMYPSYTLTPAIDPYQLTILFLLTVAPYTAATIIPSWLAASMPPDSAMRG